MVDPFRNQKIQNWAAEFAESDAAKAFPAMLQEHANTITEAFLHSACLSRNVEPEVLTEPDIKAGLLDGAGKLVLPKSTHAHIPSLCAAFLEMLQLQGRVPAGRTLPSFVRALRSAYLAQAVRVPQRPGRKSPGSSNVKPLVRPGSKLGPNAPCPCGSGKKYKKCCLRLLDK